MSVKIFCKRFLIFFSTFTVKSYIPCNRFFVDIGVTYVNFRVICLSLSAKKDVDPTRSTHTSRKRSRSYLGKKWTTRSLSFLFESPSVLDCLRVTSFTRLLLSRLSTFNFPQWQFQFLLSFSQAVNDFKTMSFEISVAVRVTYRQSVIKFEALNVKFWRVIWNGAKAWRIWKLSLDNFMI